MRKPKPRVLAVKCKECQDKLWTTSLMEALYRVYVDVTELMRKRGK